MLQAGFPVPPFIVIRPTVYRDWLASSQVPLRASRDPCESEMDATARDLADTPIPEPSRSELLHHITGALERWGSLAVRSSANVEDSGFLSFAGIFRTFLAVRDESAVLRAITACFASIFSPASRRYLASTSPKRPTDLAMSVLLQAMAPADRAGIMLTADAVNLNHSVAIINASYGLGEAIVQGEVTPDTYLVRKRDRRVIERRLGAKDKASRPTAAGSGTETYAPARALSMEFALDADELSALVTIGERLEHHFNFYQDVEWAIAGQTLYLLQSRPLTSTRLFYREAVAGESR